MNLANLARHSRNQKLSDSLRLRVFVVKAGPNPPRRREESRRVFDQWKNSFQLAKDFRVSSTDPCSVHLCSSVFICVHLWFHSLGCCWAASLPVLAESQHNRGPAGERLDLHALCLGIVGSALDPDGAFSLGMREPQRHCFWPPVGEAFHARLDASLIQT